MTDINLQFARGGAEFVVELLDRLKAATNKENIIISPFSIQSCMALVFAGSKGETATEIANALKYVSDSPTKVAVTFKNVLDLYKDSELLNIANKVYVQEGKCIRAEYAAVTKDQYDAAAESINFGESKKAADTINGWVENKTSGKIKNLLKADCLNADTRLVLLNALHFKGEWAQKFDESKTHDDDFWVGPDETTTVKFMNQRSRFGFGFIHDLLCFGLEMPYKDSDLSMFVLLPNERTDLTALSEKLKSVNLLDLSRELSVSDVMVKFPKFKIDYSVEMKNVLREMGITKVFSSSADLSNMLDPAEEVSVSQVYHKACIEVNEAGTEAAAATAAVIRKRCAPRIHHFEADHPFLYWIWNKKNILFAGAFVNAPNGE